GNIVFSLSLGGSPPVIIIQPVSQVVMAGPTTTVFFNITASGTPPLQYQWFKDSRPIPEAVLDRLRIDCAGEGDPGIYFCRVQNPFGMATSALASLVVAQNLVVHLKFDDDFLD